MTQTSWNLDGPLLLVGAGKMGRALIEGWLTKRVIDPANSFIWDPYLSNNETQSFNSLGISWEGPLTFCQLPSVVVMAVKPQVMEGVFPGFAREKIGLNTVTLSIAAGKPIASFEAHLPPASAVVRAMPNTPAAIGCGMTVLCANTHTTQTQRALCERLMAAVGEVGWIGDELLMDAVTAVSGSGPAYVFLLAEAMTNAGIKAGLDPAIAAKLARATIAGSGELLRQSPNVDAAKLRENVTSPGGTTAAALEVLMSKDGLPSLMERAVAAAVARGKALSK